jgi:pyridoxine 4-dehydrogenase
VQAGQTQLECIDLYQLRRIDPKIPAEETLAELIEEGKIRYVGLSEVSVKQIEHTRQIVPIVSVQNRYNLTDRGSEEMLEYCEGERICFIPWFPLANRDLARPGSPVEEFARRKGTTPTQIALAGCSHTPR